jgi:putative membrane protein
MRKIVFALLTLTLTFTIHARPTTEAEIVNLLMTVNTQEMNLSKLARTRAENKEVKEYAERMFKEHAENNDKASKLRSKQNIGLDKTITSQDYKFTKEDKAERLKKLSGKEFDKEFIQTQVEMHETILKKLEETLIPNTENKELKAMLSKTKENVEQHLKHAKNIQKSL